MKLPRMFTQARDQDHRHRSPRVGKAIERVKRLARREQADLREIGIVPTKRCATIPAEAYAAYNALVDHALHAAGMAYGFEILEPHEQQAMDHQVRYENLRGRF